MLIPYKIDVYEHLAMARKLREKTAAYSLTDEFMRFHLPTSYNWSTQVAVLHTIVNL